MSWASASPPSKTHLVLLDLAIIILNMVLTSIAYETELQRLMPEDTSDPLLPTSPTQSSATDIFTTSDHPSKQSPYVLDLRVNQIISRLRNPAPTTPARTTSDSLLPLPNTTPWRLSAQLQALMRVRARTRERDRPRTEADTQEQREGNPSRPERRTVPGGLESADVT